MKNKMLSLMIFALFCNIICSSATSKENSTNDIAKGVAKELLEQNTPLNIVLAIDASPSIKSNEIGDAVNEFIREINNSQNIKLGYVEWSNTTLNISEGLKPVNKFEMNEYSKHRGFTCFKIGLKNSMELLRNESDGVSKNVIILVSDGHEYCDNNKTNITDCKRDINDLDFNNIYVYYIPTYIKNNKGIEFLECLERPFGQANNELEPARNDYPKELESPFVLEMKGRDVIKTDLNTKMKVIKNVTNGEYGPRITIKIMAPNTDDLKANIVLALDSSGSMGDGGNPQYGNSIREAMPEILKSIKSILPSSYISILSWDDNIDFAYSSKNNFNPMSNNDPNSTDLVPIEDAERYISNNDIFKNNSLYESIPFMGKIFDFFGKERDYPKKYYNCGEIEFTNLSVGLDAARIILNNSLKNKNDGSLKLILFVVGRSEYARCSDSIIDATKKDHCNIHTIGLGVKDYSSLYTDLIHIAGDNNNLSGNYDQYHYSAGSHLWDMAAIETAVQNSIDQYKNRNLSNKIAIVETIYPYLECKNSGKIEVKINGESREYDLIKTTNDDGSTTLTVSFGDNLNMKPGDVIEATFDTELKLSLPVDIVELNGTMEKNIAEDYVILNETPISSVSYDWLGNGISYSVKLPEYSIRTTDG